MTHFSEKLIFTLLLLTFIKQELIVQRVDNWVYFTVYMLVSLDTLGMSVWTNMLFILALSELNVTDHARGMSSVWHRCLNDQSILLFLLQSLLAWLIIAGCIVFVMLRIMMVQDQAREVTGAWRHSTYAAKDWNYFSDGLLLVLFLEDVIELCMLSTTSLVALDSLPIGLPSRSTPTDGRLCLHSIDWASSEYNGAFWPNLRVAALHTIKFLGEAIHLLK